MAVTKLLRVFGRVQGVGFRHALQREALARGLTGWVRNRGDGTVEAALHGDGSEVEALIAWARRGPPAARVELVEVGPADEPGRDDRGFEQRPTL